MAGLSIRTQTFKRGDWVRHAACGMRDCPLGSGVVLSGPDERGQVEVHWNGWTTSDRALRAGFRWDDPAALEPDEAPE